MWKITDYTKNKFMWAKEGSIINFGNISTCHIQLEFKGDKSILIQVLLDSHLIFSIQNEKIQVFFKSYELIIFNNIFKIEHIPCTSKDCALPSPMYPQGDGKIEQNESIFSTDIEYDEVQEIYSAAYFIESLSLIQKNLSENKNFIQNNFLFPVKEVIRHSCKVMDEFFWEKKSIFEKEHRESYKKTVWMFYAQICEYGILTLPLKDAQISEIMVNETNKIYLEKEGRIYLSPLQFNFAKDLYSIIERICSSIGRRIDESMPYCDARLKDGSRVHAIIPPLALNGPCLTIRKFPKYKITPQKLVEINSVSQEVLSFLEKIIVGKKNILISGGTGSGKTTLLNCLSSFIPNYERIITIEDSAELSLQQGHVIRLESRTENVENKGKVTMRDLVKNSLRMRPDRIIVGECRGGEALDMLQAMNTGHDGSMTTVHANSPLDALRRLETLVLFAEYDLPSQAIREQITSAIHYVIQQSRLPNGHRCITAVHEIIGLCELTAKFLTRPIFEQETQ